MKSSEKSEHKLATIVERLRKSEEWAFRPRHGKNDFYQYLEIVLKEYWKWRDLKERKWLRDALSTMHNVPQRAGRMSLHVLIEVSSKQSRSIRNRWVQGLRYASLGKRKRTKIEESSLKDFCDDRGGIAGCADAWAKRKAKRAQTKPKLGVVVRKRVDRNDDDDW